ncbi:MAG TPA: RNA chaperone Hfq [Candidatus Sulfotelmatobacter sp.]|jgi:RNA chaperone Hfq|nr:RNA chaperone Hfq [Candidatus Sulfotelmatobacter sp.]
MVNRKLVRPNLAEMKEKFGPNRSVQPTPGFVPMDREQAQAPPQQQQHAPHVAPQPQGGAPGPRRRQVPLENTSAEAFYYLKQMNNRTAMVVMLDNGTSLRGHIEWYDRNCIKVNREGAPNLLVYKHSIKYMYKQDEELPGTAGTDTAQD